MADHEIPNAGGAAAANPSVKDLLAEVTLELNNFEARKLAELKAELEAIVKKKATLVDEYEKKYPVLRERWCKQHQDVEALSESLRCAFPNQDWKQLISDCICKKQREAYCLEQKINRRNHCCRGPRERAVEEAQAAFDAAQLRMNALNANTQKIEAGLGDGDKLIKEIQGLVPGPDKAIALFIFWFKLLPLHVGLTPDDVSPECKKFGEAETPWLLCKAVLEPDCKDDNPCDAKGYVAPSPGAAKSPRPAPWLMPWKNYSADLDGAWQDYRKAKNALAEAKSQLKSDPDDLESLRAKLADLNKTFEDRVRDCLKQARPDDKCCPPATAAQAEGANHA
jgi:hypothetical protein